MNQPIDIDTQVKLSIQYINQILSYCSNIHKTFSKQLNVIETEMSSKFLKDFDYNFYGIPNIESYSGQIDDYINNYIWIAERLKKILEEGDNNLYSLLNIEKIYVELNQQLAIIQNLKDLFTLCFDKINTIHAGYQTYDMSSIFNGENQKARDTFIYELNEIEKIKIQIVNLFPSIMSELMQITDEASITKNKMNTLVRDITIKQTIDFDRSLEEINQILKNYENNIRLLTEKFETRYKGFVQDTDKLKKSIDLLNKNAEGGIKNTIDLNDRVQTMEIDFSQIISEKKKKIDDELETEKNNISKSIQETKDALFIEEKTIRDAHSDFLTLVGNAGIYQLTENYNQKAKEEKREYKNFRLFTTLSLIAAIVSTIGIFIWALFDRPSSNYDFISFLWQPVSSDKMDYFLLLSRLSISLMFFVLALYLSKQASKHYECYQENHRTFLQLAALEPFMAKMNEEEQKTIRKALISTYFNQNADGKFAPPGEEVGLPSSLSTPIEKLTEVLKSLVDKSSESSKPN